MGRSADTSGVLLPVTAAFVGASHTCTIGRARPLLEAALGFASVGVAADAGALDHEAGTGFAFVMEETLPAAIVVPSAIRHSFAPGAATWQKYNFAIIDWLSRLACSSRGLEERRRNCRLRCLAVFLTLQGCSDGCVVRAIIHMIAPPWNRLSGRLGDSQLHGDVVLSVLGPW